MLKSLQDFGFAHAEIDIMITICVRIAMKSGGYCVHYNKKGSVKSGNENWNVKRFGFV